MPVASAHGGGLDADGGHTNRETGEYHYHGDKVDRREPAGDDCERPRHDPTLDVDWMREHGNIAPYTCIQSTSRVGSWRGRSQSPLDSRLAFSPW